MEQEEIKSWSDMVKRIQSLDEEETKALLNYEIVKYGRKMIIQRLHQRYCRLRRDRERQNIENGEILL